MSSSAINLGTRRVLPRFAAAMSDSSGAWTKADLQALRLGFHSIRAAQQRLSDDSLDDAFRHPLLGPLDHDDDGRMGSVSRVTHRTRDALRSLRACLLADDAPEAVVDALEEFASRLRIDDLHALALDSFLVLGDVLLERDPDRADEYRCVSGVLAMSANEWDTQDAIISELRLSRGRNAEACAWNLEARRAFVRGNLPAAERAARTAVALVDASKPSTAASLVHHTLGVVAGAQGRHQEATSILFEAYRLAPDPYRAQWALVCLAVGFYYLDRLDAAADCCALLREAENSNVRAYAVATGLLIAARRGNRAELARLRGDCESLIDGRGLTAEAAAKLCYTLGAALQHLGDGEGARSFWQRGLQIARSHQVNQTAYFLDVALSTGRIYGEGLDQLPLTSGALVADSSGSEFAELEQRLRVDRAAYELEVAG